MHYHVIFVKYGVAKERKTEHTDSADLTDAGETTDFLRSVLQKVEKEGARHESGFSCGVSLTGVQPTDLREVHGIHVPDSCLPSPGGTVGTSPPFQRWGNAPSSPCPVP